MKATNRILGTFIIACNSYLIFLSFKSIIAGGLSVFLLPFTLSTHLFLIPAVLAWKENFKSKNWVLVTNMIGIAWLVFWILFWFAPAKPNIGLITL